MQAPSPSTESLFFVISCIHFRALSIFIFTVQQWAFLYESQQYDNAARIDAHYHR